MKNKLAWLFLILISFFLSVFFLNSRVQQAGDIVEYFGISESLMSHLSIELSSSDRSSLETVLHPAYFEDPGYYITGRGGERYPVHFFFYSILIIPARLLLRFFGANELMALSLTNIFIALGIISLIFKYYLQTSFSRFSLILLLFLSPAAFFFAWPGPDLYYVMLVLLSLYCFSNRKYLLSSLMVAFASWHSQPLLVMSLLFLFIYVINNKKPKLLLLGLLPLITLSIPYFYNLIAFGVLTPWTLFQNGWTQINGFGLQNIGLKKLFEQFFDLNIGLFWYAPFIVLFGAYSLVKLIIKDKKNLLLLFAVIVTALFYQTNPAWHFGTSGYGPTRHVIFALPFFIYFISKEIKANKKGILLLSIITITQFFALSQNGWYLPNFENTLHHNAIAKYFLNNYPSLYNPTPEIFVDRTSHNDLGYISTAIYKNEQGECSKAYALKTDVDKLEKECGLLEEETKFEIENEFLNKASYPRQVITTQATFWPDSDSCEDWYKENEGPYKCLKTINEVINLVGVKEISRIQKTENYKGVWKIEHGLPLTLTVPPGYIINHYSLDGSYINYEEILE